MTARSQMRKLFGLHLPKTSRQRRRRRTQVARVLVEQLQERVMLSADPTTAWLGALPDSIPLTDISIPGTANSASGPSLQDALLGSGAENEVVPPDATSQGVNDAALAAHVAATVASEAATVAGGENQAANGTAIAANTVALAADTAAGITQISTGAGLAIGLASDITGVASACFPKAS